MSKEFVIERSKRGIPCMWECGGGYSNTGESQIIAGKNGEAKQPIYIRRRGELACCEHALIPVDVGDFIITTNHHREDFIVQTWRILDIKDDTAQAELVWEYSEGQFGEPAFYIGKLLLRNLKAAMDAAVEKATCYHCRAPHFIAR